MTFLLDTHVWLWLLVSPERVNATARAALLELDIKRLLSAASLWEAAIKVSLGKLRLERTLGHYLTVSLDDSGVQPLSVTTAHALASAGLPLHHRDPFDRMLVAQAKVEGLTLVTADPVLFGYEVELLWAGSGRPPQRSDGAGRIAEGPHPRIRRSDRDKPASRRDRASPRRASGRR